MPPALRPAFALDLHEPPPRRRNDEPAQDFATFLDEGPRCPTAPRTAVALLPIGTYPRGFVVEYDRTHVVRSPEPDLLARVARAWFGLEVRVLPALPDDVLESLPSREREGVRQLDAIAMLDSLRPRLPADAACLIALTLEDLFADDAAWVYGYADLREPSAPAIAVHSMLRYDPGFVNVEARGPDFEQVIRARALRVLVHELAHLFGLRHCVHFACIMNATAGIEDVDALPWRLCPVCLRKLWVTTGFDLEGRWRTLATIAGELGLAPEAAWFDARASAL